MKLHILSDVHLETRRTHWRSFVEQIPSHLGDVLVLAGDVLCLADAAAPEMLARLRQRAPEVLYVLGNHEHYYGAFAANKARAARLCAAAGVRLLDGSVVEVAGQRFVGASLWFPRQEQALKYRPQMSDFQTIDDFEPAVYQENARDLAFFDREIRPGDVVVSHHLPSWASVAPQFRNGPRAALNPFFVCDCEAIIKSREPALWIHGHTHTANDHCVGKTRVVCNPIGYPVEKGGEGRLDYFVIV